MYLLKALFLLLLFFSLNLSVYAQKPKYYINKKVQEIVKLGTKKVGDFTVVAIPIPYKLTLISTYYNYKSQGLSDNEIINKLRKEYREWKKTGMPFVVVFIYTGNKENTGVVVPSNLKNHLYLENNYGVIGKVKFQKIPIKRALNKNNKKVILNLIFSTIDENGRFLLSGNRITLHIKDILPVSRDIKISYPYPCRIDFSDAPPEIKYIIQKVVGLD